MSHAKGDRRERELVNALHDRDFAVLRAPASGSATARDLPDVLAGNGEHFYAMEAKSSGGQPIYLDAAEVDALEHFATNFGAVSLIATRFDYVEWSFHRPSSVYTTDGGNYRIKEVDSVDCDCDLDALRDGPPQ